MAVLASCSSAHATRPAKAAPTTAHTTAPVAARPSTTANTTTTTTTTASATDASQSIIDAYRAGIASWMGLAASANGVPSDPALARYFADPLLQGIQSYIAQLREHGRVYSGTFALANLAVVSQSGTDAVLHDCYAHNLDERAATTGVQLTHVGFVKTSEVVNVVKGSDGLWRARFTTSVKDGPSCAS